MIACKLYYSRIFLKKKPKKPKAPVLISAMLTMAALQQLH